MPFGAVCIFKVALNWLFLSRPDNCLEPRYFALNRLQIWLEISPHLKDMLLDVEVAGFGFPSRGSPIIRSFLKDSNSSILYSKPDCLSSRFRASFCGWPIRSIYRFRACDFLSIGCPFIRGPLWQARGSSRRFIPVYFGSFLSAYCCGRVCREAAHISARAAAAKNWRIAYRQS